jgi:hypothetical protein
LDLEVDVHLMISEIASLNLFIDMISEIKDIVLSEKIVRIIEFGKTERIIKDSKISRCFEWLV